MQRDAQLRLSKVLADVLSPRPSRTNVNAYFRYCHTEATRQLRFDKQASRVMSLMGIGRIEDLATDALSELFERDEHDRFTQLHRFYCGYLDWKVLSESRLQKESQRLIQQTLKDAFFDYHRTADPSLAKIIRTLKRWVSRDDRLEIRLINGRKHIVLTGSTNRSSGLITPSELASKLMSAMRGAPDPERVLNALFHVLESDVEQSGVVPLSSAALSYRACLNALHYSGNEQVVQNNAVTEDMDISSLIDHVLTSGVRPVTDKYVHLGKVSPQLARIMRQGVKIRLESIMMDSYPGVDSHYEAFKRAMPGINRTDYRRDYRNIFEYLHKLSHAHMRDLAVRHDLVQVSTAQ